MRLFVTVTFKSKEKPNGSPVTYDQVSFFQFHNDKLTIIERGRNEYNHSVDDIMSVNWVPVKEEIR